MTAFHAKWLLIALAGLGLLAGCGATSATSAPPHSAAPVAATTAPTPDITVLSAGYLAAYNTMNTADNAAITTDNAAAIGSPELLSGLKAQVADRQAFDTAIVALDTTGFAQAATDLRAVLGADAALEAALGDQESNYQSVSNYNSSGTTYEAAAGQFTSADALVSQDLGLTLNNP